MYDTLEVEDVKKAILNFLRMPDERATIKAVFRYDNTPRGRQVSHTGQTTGSDEPFDTVQITCFLLL